MRRLEHLFETTLFQSRWLLAPFYIRLVIGLCAARPFPR